jgi:hypothetical protein
MRRILAVLAIVALGVVAVAAHGAPAHAQTPGITVTPGSSNQFDTFVFSGSGFAPGTELEERYTSPDGEVFTYYINGQPAVVVAGGDGTFSVEVRPSVDFSGAREGRWLVSFCIVGGGDCWFGTIDIAA